MRQIVIPAVVIGAFAAVALAQEPAAAEKPKVAPAAAPAEAAAKGTPRTPRIAVLDIDRVWAESLLGKTYVSQIEKEQSELNSLRTKKENELQKMTNEIKAMEDDLQKQASVLSADVVDKRQKDINKKKRDAQDFVTDGREEVTRSEQHFQQQQQLFQSEFLQKVQPYIESAGRERGIDILLHKQAAFTVNREFDISQDVIVKADDAERAARAKGAAAKPAEKPGAPAPKPPVPSPAASPKP